MLNSGLLLALEEVSLSPEPSATLNETWDTGRQSLCFTSNMTDMTLKQFYFSLITAVAGLGKKWRE